MFGASVEPGNTDIQAKTREIKGRREEGQPSVPSTIGNNSTVSSF